MALVYMDLVGAGVHVNVWREIMMMFTYINVSSH